jgi:hypothetical protein
MIATLALCIAVVAGACVAAMRIVRAPAQGGGAVMIPDRWIAADIDADGGADWIALDTSVGEQIALRAYSGAATRPTWETTLDGRAGAPAVIVRRADRLLVPLLAPGPTLVTVRLADGAVLARRELPGHRWADLPVADSSAGALALTGDDETVHATALDRSGAHPGEPWQRSFAGRIAEVRAGAAIVDDVLMVPMDGWTAIAPPRPAPPLRDVGPRRDTRGAEIAATEAGAYLVARPERSGGRVRLLAWDADTQRFAAAAATGDAAPRSDDLWRAAAYPDRLVALLDGALGPRLRVVDLGGEERTVGLSPRSWYIAASPLARRASAADGCSGRARFVPLVLQTEATAVDGARLELLVLDTRGAAVTWRSGPLPVHRGAAVDAAAPVCAGERYHIRTPARDGGTGDDRLLVLDGDSGRLVSIQLGARDDSLAPPFAGLAPEHILGTTIQATTALGRVAVDWSEGSILLDDSGLLALSVEQLLPAQESGALAEAERSDRRFPDAP